MISKKVIITGVVIVFILLLLIIPIPGINLIPYRERVKELQKELKYLQHQRDSILKVKDSMKGTLDKSTKKIDSLNIALYEAKKKRDNAVTHVNYLTDAELAKFFADRYPRSSSN